MLKYLFISFIAIIVLFFIFAMNLPNQAETSRSIKINRPADSLSIYLTDVKIWEKWMPWKDLDSATQYSYPNEVKGIGATQIAKSGEKSIKSVIRGIKEKDSIWYDVIWNGGENITRSSFKLSQNGNVTKVTWKYHTDLGDSPLAKFSGLLMDKMFGESLESGLKKLKKEIEK